MKRVSFLVLFAFFPLKAPLFAGTSTWTTLRNNSVGIEYQYPSNWRVIERKGSVTVSNVAVFSEYSDESLANEARFTSRLRSEGNPQKLSIQQWFKARDFAHTASNPPRNISEAVVGGRPAIRCEVVEIVLTAHYFIQAENQTDIVEITFPLTQPKFESTYEGILKSIKFKKLSSRSAATTN